MLRVTVELVPHGIEERKSVIATGTIYNDGASGFKELGDYVALFESQTHGVHKTTLKNYERRRNVWELVYECLKNVYEVRV